MTMPDSNRPFSFVAREEIGAPPDALARDAIGVVLRRLIALPLSPEVQALLPRAEEYLRQAQAWRQSPRSPWTAREWDALMVRVLGLHVAVTKLERGSTGRVRVLGQS
jgi:hypothetical protein